MNERDPVAARRLEWAGALMHAATPQLSLEEHLQGRSQLVAAVEKMRKPRGALRARPLATFAFATAVAATVLFFVRARAPSALAWHVENGPAGAIGAPSYLSIPQTAASARLVFDDGSHVVLEPGARGRVAATTPVGAEVVLEQGKARVHVTHHDRTSWLVDAGPFSVRVTGTDFLVAWAADAEMLDVWMRSGHVVVKGPVIGDAQPLSAGQHLRARLHDGTVQIDVAPEPADVLAAPAGATGDSTPVVAPIPEPSGTNPGPGASAVALPWSKLVSTGDFARVVRDAEAEGVGRALATRPLADLRILGDAARYADNPSLARGAYASIRSRFAASTEARTAAFLLGRVAEEQDHANGEAVRWYDTYLAEAPGGAFAGDALGRKMVIASKAQGRDAAKPLADRYLQRFPTGPYAAAARTLSP